MMRSALSLVRPFEFLEPPTGKVRMVLDTGMDNEIDDRSKPLWDIGPIAWLVNRDWVETTLVHSPILTTEHTWSHDPHRHLIREAWYVYRDAIFADLFRKLGRVA